MNRATFLAATAVAALLAIGTAWADTPHEMNGIVVSTNTYAETLTMTIEGGVHHTAKVKGEALKTLGMLHAGDEVAVLCHDHNGQHEAVTIIKVTKEARGSYRH